MISTVYSADILDGSTLIKKEEKVPDVPSFSMKYNGDMLECFPNRLIRKKTHKNTIEYRCVKKYIAASSTADMEISGDEQRGRDETKRLRQDVEDRMKTGRVTTVEISEGDARRPWMASYVAKRKLENRFYAKYIKWMLPAKFYISLRPQLAGLAGSPEETKLHDGGSRAGFFYYYRFDNDIDLTLQYEGKIDWTNGGRFINLSDTSNTLRRLSYLSLDYKKQTLLLGKYWSAYYDIAGWTDHFMAYGAQASGAFNSSSDGSGSGTGRADEMLQAHSVVGDFHTTLQYQKRHNGQFGMDTDYLYGVAASTIYKGWSDYGFQFGLSAAYARFVEITPLLSSLGITGSDQSYIAGFSYRKKKFLVNAVLSYSKNHMNDDQGIYFDGVGAELYAHYDFTDSIRFAGGFNWLNPRESEYQSEYQSEYSVKKGIFSLQYTFGKKTFDDLFYLEVALPHGRSANGESYKTSTAFGMRYRLDF